MMGVQIFHKMMGVQIFTHVVSKGSNQSVVNLDHEIALDGDFVIYRLVFANGDDQMMGVQIFL